MPESVKIPLPWETGSGFLAGLPLTVYLVLCKPARVFAAQPEAGWLRAMIFAVIVSLIPAALLWPLGAAPSPSLWLLALVWMPFNAGLVHLMLWAVGGATQGFAATLRVAGYAQAAILLTFIPAYGLWVFGLWHLAVMIIGLAAAHQTQLVRSVAANLVPILCALLLSATGLVSG